VGDQMAILGAVVLSFLPCPPAVRNEADEEERRDVLVSQEMPV
jgi:hypothetical protein